MPGIAQEAVLKVQKIAQFVALSHSCYHYVECAILLHCHAAAAINIFFTSKAA
jgi:hypothetical protein